MQKQIVLFKLLLCLLFITMIKTNSLAQTGLNFQGVARSSNNVIIASQQISLRLSILQGSATGNVEYSETRKVTTNAQGLFAVVIGDADATSTMGSFNNINWKNTPKYLKIEMDASAGNNYTTVGATQFQYVAYAQFASSVDAENIAGIVPVNKGGTGVSSITALKTALSLDKINNTADADKSISTKTQTALDLKLNAADTSKYTKQSYTDAALLTKFNLADTGKYTKQVYTDSSLITKLKLSDTASMLSSRIGKDTLNLSARINAKANTSDVNTAMAIKANASDVATSLLSKLNKTDTSYLLQKVDTATLSNRINLKANASDVTTSLSSKVDKVTGKELSTNDYSTVEKDKLAAITGTNTGDQDLSSYATNTSLALKANTTDVTTGLGLKANALDVSINLANKASTLDLTTGLATKVDKVTGKNLSTNDYSTVEKDKLAAITGANTGDQDLSSYATKTALALKANTSDLNTSLSLKASITDVTTSLALKEDATNKSTATDLGGVSPSDVLFPTQKAVKDYVTANAGSGAVADGGITNIKLADGAVTYAKFQSVPTYTILGNTSSSTTSVQAIATTGSDNVVLSTSPTITSPTLITPNIGAAKASSINDVIINGFNFKSDVPSITITGITTLQGNNTGDDATNSKYEGLLTNGAVDLINDQAIDGKKTFLNNITMANLLGVGSVTPTTINFANGSMIGDIQNIHEDNPDIEGSIDLYAPDGAKWVQMNYGNANYIWLNNDIARIEIGNMDWTFDKDGSTGFPVGLKIQKNEGTPEIISDHEIAITSKDYLRLRFDDNGSYTRLGIYKDEAELYIYNDDFSSTWNYQVDGSSWFPGDLNFTDNHAINFTSTGTSTTTTNASITATGPFLKIQTRPLTPDDDTDAENGISLEYENLNNIKINSSGVQLYTWNTNNGTPSFVDVRESSFNFLSNDNSNNQNRWYFNGADASTNLPGALLLTGNIETEGTLTLGSTIFTNQPATNGYVLTYNAGNAIWQAPTGGSGGGISSINGLTDLTQLFAVGTDGADFNISSASGTHTFNIPDASTNNRGLLTSADYIRFNNKQDAMDYATASRGGYLRTADFNIFNNKQDALTNPLVGSGLNTNGEIPFFNGTNSTTSDPNLFWDATHKRVGIRTNAPASPLEVRQGDEDEFGISVISPPRSANHAYGSSIGFYSNVIDGNPSSTYNGSFQLDADGSMVFRTMQGGMYFDNAGTGSMIFRMGNPSANIGMSLSNSGNLEVAGTLKLGSVVYPKVSGTSGDVLTADASGNAIWQAPIGTSVDANSLAGSTLKSTIINSSLTSVGTLANLSVTNPINGSILGNAATVTTNANLTGVVTSIGNLTSIASGAITNSMIANTAVASLTGVNTGDNAVNSNYSSLVSNATHTGDATGSTALTVVRINGTSLAGLNTGILKNTTGTGVPSIAVASDFPTLNQSTTGNAATTTKLASSRNINGVAFDGTADITITANAGTLTGTSLNSTVINSSLTSVGTLSNLTVTNSINGSITGNAATATKLATSRNINGVAFDGTSNITITADAGTLTGTSLKSTITSSSLTSVGTLSNLTVINPISGSISGNAATATKLATSRNINGIAFDGTGDITIAASAGTLTGTSLNATVTGSSLTSVGVLNNATVNGKVIVGASAEASSSAILEASSTTQGFLPPRMTIAQRLAITNPAQGLMIYCTNCGTFGEPQYYNGNAWLNFAGTASSKGTPTINITVGTYTFTASTPQGPNAATNTGTGSTYTYTYVGTGSTTYASSSTRPTNSGTYSVTVSLSASGDGNYNAATASAAFTIAQAIPTVTPTIGTYNYISGTPQGPTAATNTGTGTNYIYSYTGTGITTYGPSATKPTDGGTYTVIATVAANGNYAASSSAPTAFSIKTNLAVGNSYGGGKVAYILRDGDIGYDANQQHGLIVSGYLSTNMVVWGNKLELTGASGGAGIYNQDYGTWDYPPADLETGMNNTNLIISSEGAGTNYPASIARSYSGGGYTNWYLPSASQMNAMKANLSPSGVNYVWTSTEDGAYDAFTWNIINGGYQTQQKDFAIAKFLAARSF